MRLIGGILSAQSAGGGSPAGLTLVEVGADISPDPTYTFNDPDHEITSGGGTNSQENFGFAYLSLPIADYEIISHFKTLDTSDYIDHVGIQFRNENVSSNPICFANFLRYVTSGTWYQYGYGRRRGDLPYQGLTSAGSIGASMSDYAYLKIILDSTNSQFSCWHSSDGSSWTQNGSTQSLFDVSGGDAWDNGGVMRFGMSVSSRNNTAIFDQFEVNAL